MPLETGSNFGPYRIVSPLGRGGMASVYKAYEPGLDRFIALKVLPAAFLHDPDFAERFTREAKVIAKLEHPRIVPIYAFGIEAETPWMAMRLVPGGALSSLLKRGRIPPQRAVQIMRAVAEALDHAHGEGVLHRDVKPQNILIHEKGYVYLADFGIAKMLAGTTVMTEAGKVVGTPQYMSPEQAKAQKVDHRADLYALGIITYEMLTGKVPFTADTPMVVMMQHIMDPVPLPPLDEVPEALVQVVMKCLAKNPADRWDTALAFAAALEKALETGTAGEVDATLGRSERPTPPAPVTQRAAERTAAEQTLELYAPTDIQDSPTALTPPGPAQLSMPPAQASSPRALPKRLLVGAALVVVVATTWMAAVRHRGNVSREEAVPERQESPPIANRLAVALPAPTTTSRPTPSPAQEVESAPTPVATPAPRREATPRATPAPTPFSTARLQGQVVVVSPLQKSPLAKVALTLRDDQGVRHTLTVDAIAPGESVYVWGSRWTPPLSEGALPSSVTIEAMVDGQSRLDRFRF